MRDRSNNDGLAGATTLGNNNDNDDRAILATLLTAPQIILKKKIEPDDETGLRLDRSSHG